MKPIHAPATVSTPISADRPHNQSLGAHGESIAEEYLTDLGYRILARNWRVRDGELDLIAEDHNDIVAVEVKTRNGTGYGHPLEAITAIKAARVRRLLLTWVRQVNPRCKNLRVDAIGITIRHGQRPRIDHLEGIS